MLWVQENVLPSPMKTKQGSSAWPPVTSCYEWSKKNLTSGHDVRQSVKVLTTNKAEGLDIVELINSVICASAHLCCPSTLATQ